MHLFIRVWVGNLTIQGTKRAIHSPNLSQTGFKHIACFELTGFNFLGNVNCRKLCKSHYLSFPLAASGTKNMPSSF